MGRAPCPQGGSPGGPHATAGGLRGSHGTRPLPMRPALPLLLLALLAACAEAPPPSLPPGEAAARDSVVAALRAADRRPFEEAFEALGHTPHTVSERLEQVDPIGRVTATRTRTLRVAGGAPEVLSADSSGTFDLGTFGRFVSLDAVDRLPANPLPHLLPEDPPYLSPRGGEAYAFAFEPDTTLGGRPVRVPTARAHSGADPAIREAVLFVDPASGALVGARVRRRQASPLFGETSTLAVLLRPEAGGWLPASTRFDVALRAPLTASRRFRLTREYAYAGPQSMRQP